MRVLVVEDDAELRNLLGKVLSRAGHEVVLEGSGEEGLQRLGREPVDVLVTDLRMPRPWPPGLLRRLRQEHPDLRLIVLSALEEDEGGGGAESPEGCERLLKPVRVARLLEAVAGRTGTGGGERGPPRGV